MPNKLYQFIFSPPARLAWLTAKIYDVPTEIIEIDLSKGEHLDMDFIKMNPKHEVPIFDHDGKIVTESRGIAKYFHENFNQDLEKNDHWYPKDPEERAKVDEWLDWSDKRHMSICIPPLMTALNTYGMPWRENFGIFITKMSSKMKNDPKAIKEMEQNLSEAEEILSKREINQVSDLNLGDLATFLETSLPFFILPNVKYEDYPALANLYKTMKHIPEFEEIDQKFGEFIKRIHDLQNSSNNSPTIFTTMGEIWTTIKLVCYLKWNGIDMRKNLPEKE